MQLTKHIYIGIVVCFSVAVSCSSPSVCERPNPLIVVTTGIIGDAIQHIVKDSANVQALMGPGVDPHLYKASLGDLKKLMSADVVLYQGLHLEGKMGEVLDKLARTEPVFSLTGRLPKDKIIQPLEGGDFPDPHIWFDVSLWKSVVQEANSILSKHFPTCEDYFNKNTRAYLIQLDSLDSFVRRSIQQIPRDRRILITSHDAFSYFGKAYQMEVKGLQGISTQAEFGLRDVADMVKLIDTRNVKAIFVENSVSKKSLEAVIAGVKSKGKTVKIGATLYTDALGAADTPEGTYIGMVRYNVEAIVHNLK